MGDWAIISADDSPVTILVIANDDERLVAWETLRAIERNALSWPPSRKTSRSPSRSRPTTCICPRPTSSSVRPRPPAHPEHELSQPGQFACAERCTWSAPRGASPTCVLGPTRKETQVEIAMTEQFKVGIQPPIRESGDLANTPGITLEGPFGSTTIERGVICAQRHIHMTPEDAMRFHVRDKYIVRVRIEASAS
jgi:acetate kinase